jgi:glucokinase
LYKAGERLPDSPIACIGAGTGLGECYLTPTEGNGQYRCFASEGGHADYSPRTNVKNNYIFINS